MAVNNRLCFGVEAGGASPTPTDACGLRWQGAKEIDEEFGNASGFFVLKPVRGTGESVELGGVAIAETVVGHVWEEKGVALAPEDACGDVDSRVREFAAMAEGGAVPVDHAGERAGLRPSGAVLGEIFVGKSVWATGTEEGANAEAEVVSGECGFGNEGKLEKEHVPTSAKLATI